MEIRDVETRELPGGRTEIRASAGGVPLELRLPTDRFQPHALGDALVISALVPAMKAGTPLVLPSALALSPQLDAGLPGIQRTYAMWNRTLRPVEVVARRAAPAWTGRDTALFYAGGVDSSYSLIAHERELDALVTVFGFDFTMSAEDTRASIERNAAFARAIGKDILFVESTHSIFLRAHRVSRTLVFGATLASVALLLGFRRTYIASSHSMAFLRADGSHPLVDPHYSNGVTEIVHDDVSVSRLDKTRAIARRPDVLANLRVCWNEPNANCGRCGKCVRTMVALQLCGVRGPFPAPPSASAVRGMAASTDLDYVVELAVAARDAGDARLSRLLRQGLRRQDLVEAVRYLSYALTGRKLRRPSHWGGGIENELAKIDLRPDLVR